MNFSEIYGSRVLITGGLGFIGSNLTIRCVELGCQVTLLTRSLEKSYNIAPVSEKVRLELSDLSTGEQAVSTLRSLLPGQDFIFHMAAQTSHIQSMKTPLQDLEINCATTLALLEGCRDLAPESAIVMPCTVTQVGRVDALPVDENIPDWPLSLYDTHKLTCEKYLYVYHENYGLKTTTLRLANVFGERQQVNNPHRGILNYMLKRALTGEPLTIYEPGDFIRDYSYVQNVVDALLLAATAGQTAGQAYIFGSGVGLKFHEMVEQVVNEVRSLVGLEAEIRWVPFPPSEKKIDSGNFIADNSKFCKHTGWVPQISFTEGLHNTIRFYQKHMEEYSSDR